MKNRKMVADLQLRGNKSIVWPNDLAILEWNAFSRQVKQVTFENLTKLPHSEISEASQSWVFNARDERWEFVVSATLLTEDKPDMTRFNVVTTTFHLPARSARADLTLAIEILDTDIGLWRKSIAELRKLQLHRVITNEGQAAFTAAVERGM